jgi:hypothetical protein
MAKNFAATAKRVVGFLNDAAAAINERNVEVAEVLSAVIVSPATPLIYS